MEWCGCLDSEWFIFSEESAPKCIALFLLHTNGILSDSLFASRLRER